MRRFADAERLRGDRRPGRLAAPTSRAGTPDRPARAPDRRRRDVELEIHAAEAADAERIGARRARDAGRVHRHEKRRDALRRADPAVCTRRRWRRAAASALATQTLRPRDAIAAAVLHRAASADWRRRCRRSGSDSAKAPMASPLRELAQPLLLLRRASGMRDQLGDERVVHDSDTATVALARAIASMAIA